jgi:hypothetical protein
MSDELKTYYVGLSVRVRGGDGDEDELSGHRIEFGVNALNAEHAANAVAYALGCAAKDYNTKPAKKSKAK